MTCTKLDILHASLLQRALRQFSRLFARHATSEQEFSDELLIVGARQVSWPKQPSGWSRPLPGELLWKRLIRLPARKPSDSDGTALSVTIDSGSPRLNPLVKRYGFTRTGPGVECTSG